jgi:transcription antitermination factor NusG
MRAGVADLDEATEGHSERWYAIYTKHQHEKTCSDLLTRKTFEVYLPTYESVRQWKDRKKKLAVPLFPGYVFLRTNLERPLDILSVPGVFFIVGTAGRASSIPDQDIESLRALTKSQLPIEPHVFLQRGDHVRVRRGPLTGMQGILMRVNNQNRVVVCVEPLQKAVSVEVDINDVAKMDATLPVQTRRNGEGCIYRQYQDIASSAPEQASRQA